MPNDALLQTNGFRLLMTSDDSGNGGGNNNSLSDDGNSDDGNNDDDDSDSNFLTDNPISKFFKNNSEAQEDARIYSFSLIFAVVLRLLIVEPRYIPSLSMFVGERVKLFVEIYTCIYFAPRRSFSDVIVF